MQSNTLPMFPNEEVIMWALWCSYSLRGANNWLHSVMYVWHIIKLLFICLPFMWLNPYLIIRPSPDDVIRYGCRQSPVRNTDVWQERWYLARLYVFKYQLILIWLNFPADLLLTLIPAKSHCRYSYTFSIRLSTPMTKLFGLHRMLMIYY